MSVVLVTFPSAPRVSPEAIKEVSFASSNSSKCLAGGDVLLY